jgi:hypothetical protein
MNESDEITGPLADVFVSEEEYKKQMQENQEHEVEREIDPDSVYPSQIFNTTFYKLRESEQVEKLVDYLTKDHTIDIGINTELVKEHREDCVAVRNVEKDELDNAWTFAKAETVHQEYDEEKNEWKNTVKTRHDQGRMYLFLTCNYTECDAKLRVDAKQLLKFITKVAMEDV